MRRFGSLLAAIAVMTFADPAAQEKKEQRASPHDTARATVGGAKIEIAYGRPYKKGRDVWNTPVTEVPSKEVWRLGANEATLLDTSAPLNFGTLTVPAGKYSLFMAHTGGGNRQLIVNKQTGQWGTEYDPSQDVGRVDMKREELSSPVEQLTIAVEPTAGGGVLKVTWDSLSYSAPFSVQK
jgi:hypothetical protein